MVQAHGTRVIEVGGAATLSVPRVRLELPGRSKDDPAIRLGPLPLVLGSSDAADQSIDDATVSARHVELSLGPHGARVRDLGSTNGTFVAGVRVGDAWLQATSRVTLGEAVIDVIFEGGADELRLTKATDFNGLLGHSPAMRSAFAMLEAAAKTDSTVLLIGESGTGKELAARGVHERSARRAGPFVVFDCGAATASLLEAQLVGHAKGAFTGALEARAGVFEAAEGGTLVLDEIGELPLELQPKLLRALEARTVTRVGETKPRAIDVRFVASTHRLLDAEVRAGRFRQDLYFRLGVITVRLPPLRERREEIPRLLNHLLARLAPDREVEVPPAVLRLLARHDFPGNVRELRNFAERFLALEGLPPEALLGGAGAPAREGAADARGIRATEPFHESKRLWMDRFERAYLEDLLSRSGGNISEAARLAGLSRQSCYRLMEKHGLETPEGR
ncbi:MAG: sigma 54-interacting transcriptional regulator [Polyangiaceae bacterium]